MAPVNFTNEPVTDDPSTGDSGGLNSFQIHITIVFVLAFLCLVTGIINYIIHRLEQTRRAPFQMKPLYYEQTHLDTVSATVTNKNTYQNGQLNGHPPLQVKFSKGKRKKSVKHKRSTSIKSGRAARNTRIKI